jgi:MFS family permease
MSENSSQVAEPHDPYAALRYPNFRLLIIGRAIAQIGEMMVSVSVAWELYQRTKDPLALGLIGLSQVIPVILFSLPGGYIADRYDRKRVTLITQVILVVFSLLLAWLSLTEGSLVLIYALLALIGTARAFNNPAESALTPQLVPQEHFFNASTWSSGVWQISAVLGPAIGGGVVALTGQPASVYFLNAAAGMVLVVALLLIRVRQKGYETPGETPLQALRGGLRFVWSTQEILGAISLDMFAVLFGGAVFLLPIVAQDILHTDATGFGLLRAAPSVGALSMAFFLSRRPPFQHAGRTMLLAVAGFGVATIVFGLSKSFGLSLLMLAMTGALDNISVVVRHTLVLTHTPDPMLGRVGAVNTVFIGASNELGGFESGVAAALLGTVGSIVFGGIGTLAVVGLIAWKAPKLRRLGRIGDELDDEAEKRKAEAQPVEMVEQV